MPKYTITFTASPDDARVLLELAVKALTTTELSELHFTSEEPQAETKRTPATHSRAPRVNGTSGPQVLFDLLSASGGKIKREILQTQLAKKGYSPTSVGPFSSVLRKKGLLDFNKPHYYLTDKGKLTTQIREVTP